MANICTNTFVFFEKDNNQLQLKMACMRLLAAIKESENRLEECNMKDLLCSLGCKTEEVSLLDGRTWIDTYQLIRKDEKTIEGICIDAESAWSPCKDAMQLIKNTLGDNFDFVYMAEEPGSAIYINTDKKRRFLDIDYMIRVSGNDDEEDDTFYIYHWDDSEQLCLDHINKLSGLKYRHITQVIDHQDIIPQAINKKQGWDDACIEIYTYEDE